MIISDFIVDQLHNFDFVVVAKLLPRINSTLVKTFPMFMQIAAVLSFMVIK